MVSRIGQSRSSALGSPCGARPRVDAQQLALVVEHLLEVRDRPARVDAVAVEAAAELVVETAARHLLAGDDVLEGHSARLLRSGGSRGASSSSRLVGVGNFGARRSRRGRRRIRAHGAAERRCAASTGWRRAAPGLALAAARRAPRRCARRRLCWSTSSRRSPRRRRSRRAPGGSSACRGAAPAGSRCRRRRGLPSGVQKTVSGQPPCPCQSARPCPCRSGRRPAAPRDRP